MGRSILLVDDSVALVGFLEKKLRAHFPNADVTNSRLAGDAVQKAVAARPDVLLVDYALPDLKGDEVCRLLYHNPTTALLPVILFYGDGVDIERLRAANPNIVATLQKPFPAEALTEEIEKVFSQPRIAVEIRARFEGSTYGELGIATSKVLFRANSALFSIGSAFRHISTEKLSGVFRILLKKQPIEVYCEKGRVRLATTKDLQLYVMESSAQFANTDRDAMAMCAKGQMDSACPYFILLALRGLLPAQEVPALVHSHGLRLVSRAFVAPKVFFEFEDLNAFPEFLREVPGEGIDAVAWAFDSLRQLTADQAMAAARVNPADVPAFTPESIKLIELLELAPSEMRFAETMDGSRTLAALTANLALTPAEGAALYFRFQSLGMAQMWPATAFAR